MESILSNNESTNLSPGFEIPFMSQITDFISKKKCLRIEKYRQVINKDIVDLELQEDQGDKSLNKTFKNKNLPLPILTCTMN
jgi:hypothetical protein